MRKTFEDLCPGQSPEDVLVDYAVYWFSENDWPPEVILAVLALKHPDRTFAIDDEECGDLCECSDAVDVAEEQRRAKEELATLEGRVKKLKRQLAHVS
jgi:hypothetical protein